jgi:choline dehydrogenase-like flavoprotein
MKDVLIIGSGISGTSAALRLAERGIRSCMVDVGIGPPPKTPIKQNLYDFCGENECFDLLVGSDFEGLRNLHRNQQAVPVKLTAPGMSFVTDRSKELSPVREKDFCLVQSFAQGGLANAWGAGVMRFTSRDLDGFPFEAQELSPYYDSLTKEMGISGENDDLTPYFGKDRLLQKPLRLSSNASLIYSGYLKKKERLNRRGVFIGRPRLAVLTEEKDGRTPCEYSNLEFWQPHLPYLYYPSLTLGKLIGRGDLEYRDGLLAKSWHRRGEAIVVEAVFVKDQKRISFECKKLILAAGAVGNAKLALASRRDYRSKLILLDNRAVQFPFLLPKRIGKRLEKSSFGLTQLNFVYDPASRKEYYQGSLLDLIAPARAEFYSNFPFAASDNIKMIKYILPAMMVLQLYLPSMPETGASLSLSQDGEVEILGKNREVDKKLIGEIIRIFRKLGALTSALLVVKPSNGLGIHYAGTLPMTGSPKNPYECDRFGELFGEPGVYVADGSTFPRLSSKNFSFAVMANAMRIADGVVQSLKG